MLQIQWVAGLCVVLRKDLAMESKIQCMLAAKQ